MLPTCPIIRCNDIAASSNGILRSLRTGKNAYGVLVYDGNHRLLSKIPFSSGLLINSLMVSLILGPPLPLSLIALDDQSPHSAAKRHRCPLRMALQIFES